jgi:hypothetical protein
MSRMRSLSWLIISAVLLSALAPIMPVHAASPSSLLAPIRQVDQADEEEIANRIADIRSEDADVEDDFATDTGMWNIIYDGTTSRYFKSGELRIAVDDESSLAWSIADIDVEDFYVETEAIHHDGSLDNQYGILFRYEDADNYYLFAASSDGYYSLQLRTNNEWISLIDWQESDVIETGEGSVNKLGVLAEGDLFTLLINDYILEQVTDDTLAGTGIALSSGAYSEPPIDIGFDNFFLWELGTSSNEPRPVRIPDRSTPSANETPSADVTTTPEPSGTVTPETTPESTPEPSDDLTAAIADIQAKTPTYSTDFSDELTGWNPLIADGVSYEQVDDALELVFNAPNMLAWTELPEAPTTYYVEVDATVASPTTEVEYGIIFNYKDAQNFYLYGISNSSRYSVWRLADNEWETIADWADSSALLAGEGNTNTLGLLMLEDNYALIANGEVLTVLENSQPPLGSVALAAGTFAEANLIVRFDNLNLWDLGESASSLPTSEATATSAAEEPTPTAEVTAEMTEEPTEEPTDEPTEEPTEEVASGDLDAIAERIDEIIATDPTLSDTFTEDTGMWDTIPNDSGGAYYLRRALNIDATEAEIIIYSGLIDDSESESLAEYDDFYAEFDTSFITLTGENAAGLMFRLADSNNFYMFKVDEIGYYQLEKRVDGESTDLVPWAISEAFDESENAVNRIGVLAEGNTLAFTLNGTVLAVVEDEGINVGGLALAVQTYSAADALSSFDNFDLWLLGE